ncbi:MAG: hypothetical protein ACPGYT_02555 [Nitrospirales bacterium]
MNFLVWDNWMFMALITPALSAVSCIIDVCFVGGRIFRFPSDAPVISGIFCLVPLFVLGTEVGGWEAVTLPMIVPALVAGVCYFLHVYFVFRALFTINDASCSETFNTLSVLLVPVLVFAVLGERLSSIYYVAISIALGGILVLIRYHLSGVRRRAVVQLSLAVMCISCTMVLQAWVFAHMPYWNGVLLFTLGSCLSTLAVLSVCRERRSQIFALCSRFGLVFLLAELLELSAILSWQRATAIGPSVSFVAVVECSLPLFVMAFSLVFLAISRHWAVVTPVVREALSLQASATPVKLASLALILIAIMILQVTVP